VNRRVLNALAIGLTALTVAVLAFAVAKPVVVVPRAFPAPDFDLTDQNGARFTQAEFRGKVSVVNFIYTSCTTVCPVMTAQMKMLEQRMAAEGAGVPGVSFVSFTFDPERDTPEALHEYSARFDAVGPAWHFLTGAEREMKRVVGDGFGVYYEKLGLTGVPPEHAGHAGYEFKHDNRFLLLDSAGLVRAQYDGATLDAGIVARDIGLISKEAASRGAMRLVYEAAHFLQCYPSQIKT
jgi:protein SCO1/2